MLYCVSHKPLSLPTVPDLQLMQVGNGESFTDVRDNVGENIATRNTGYSENTAFYQVWKNRPSDYVGFCHYRRFFLTTELHQHLQAKLQTATLPGGEQMQNYASGSRVAPDALFEAIAHCEGYVEGLSVALGESDVLLPKANSLPAGGFMAQYAQSHPLWPFMNLLSLMSKQDNRLAADAIDFFTRQRQAYWNNLFYMRWPLFERYCEFLFHWLFELEAKTAQPQHPYQQRVFAFISERLLNFWLYREGLNVVEADWCMTEDVGLTTEAHQQVAHRIAP